MIGALILGIVIGAWCATAAIEYAWHPFQKAIEANRARRRREAAFVRVPGDCGGNHRSVAHAEACARHGREAKAAAARGEGPPFSDELCERWEAEIDALNDAMGFPR